MATGEEAACPGLRAGGQCSASTWPGACRSWKTANSSGVSAHFLSVCPADLGRGGHVPPTPPLTLHTTIGRGVGSSRREDDYLYYSPKSYRFMRSPGDADLVPLFFPFYRVWQLERTGQGSGQQEHSSCGSKSSVLPSPEARPPGMWQGQPIFPASRFTGPWLPLPAQP